MSAYSEIELTPDGRLLFRRQQETPEGLRERLDDITAEAQHWLDRIVALQPGVRLSSIFDLLKANATLMDLYTHNWAHEYAARYDALRAGDLVADPSEDVDPSEPAVESLVLSLSQELRIPNDLLWRIAAAQDELVERLELVPIDDRVSQRYGEIRAHLECRGTPIGANDLWIAAQGSALGVGTGQQRLGFFGG